MIHWLRETKAKRDYKTSVGDFFIHLLLPPSLPSGEMCFGHIPEEVFGQKVLGADRGMFRHNVTRFACDGVFFNGSNFAEIRDFVRNLTKNHDTKCSLLVKHDGWRLPGWVMLSFNDFLLLAFAFIGILVVFLFLLETIWSFLQVTRAILAPYLLNNVDDSSVNRFGQWALITGCTDGIGKEYAFEMAKRGHNIVLVSRSKDKLETVAKEIECQHNVKTKYIVADFSKGQSAIETIKTELGSLAIGVLVNNVGANYTYPMYVGEVPKDELWNIININIGAVTMLTNMIVPEMKKRMRGAVVNISSGSELQPLPFMAVYAATKVYVKSFTEALRWEYSKFNITVQHISPFFINTKMNNFSNRLRRTSVFVPDAKSYAKYCAASLGKVDHTTGYWSHGIQYFFVTIAPVWLRSHIGGLMNKSFRREYLKNHSKIELVN